MKFLAILGFLAISFLGFESSALALSAEQFKGVYEALNEHGTVNAKEQAVDRKLVACDNDTVGNIWARWAEGELPADLEKYRNEPAILVFFTYRNTVFFTLERTALIGPTFMALPGNNDDRLELQARADGHYDLGVREAGKVTFYELGPKEPLPTQTH